MARQKMVRKAVEPPNGTRKRGRKRKLRCLDLFAGAGGFSLAAKRAGVKVVAAVEYDKNACETYRANLVHGSSPKLFQKDINVLSLNEITECFDEENSCDVVLGGPPCQGFSAHRINDAGLNDPRNELIHRYFEFVTALQPKAFLMENVPGLMWPRHKASLKRFYTEALKAGYNVMEPEVIDARDYGLPQRRKRVFILGLRSDLPAILNWVPEPTHGSASAVKKNKRLKPWVSCSKVFSRRIRKNDPNNIHMNHSTEMVALFKMTPKNGGSRSDTGRVLPCHEEHDGHKDVYGRIDSRKSAPTMTTACINPSKGRFVHPTKNHGITLRHAARIQTFPDSFEFKGGLMAGGVQVGNAVPVALGEVLLKRLTEIIQAQEGLRRKPKSTVILEAAE